jgi:hypothetical protein
LVRIADAHLLTIEELEREIGGSLSGLDRGDSAHIPRLAAMTGADATQILAMVSADLLAHPMRKGPRPPDCWAVCPACFRDDQAKGRALYIRRSWVHPLSAFCRTHRTPLVPHGNSDMRIASDLTLFGNGGDRSESRDNLLCVAEFDNGEMIAKVMRALDGTKRPENLQQRLRLRWAVRDVIDALTTNRRTHNGGALIQLFEEPIFQRRSHSGSNIMQLSVWDEGDAATRLLHVRLALLVLAEPSDPDLTVGPFPLDANWLANGYRHSRIRGWQSLYEHAVQDPLFLFAMELPREAVLELGRRSLAWPEDLRRRWTYAAAVGAVGGFVF